MIQADRRTILLAGIAALTLPGAASPDPGSVVRTTSGRLRGTRAGGVLAFQGVPYAAPCGGAARWLPPRAARPWQGIRPAIKLPEMCPQPTLGAIPEEAAVLQKGPVGEDCLALNIWTPATSGKRPVMVWFHGGGYMQGSGAAASTNGTRLAHAHDVVVVTINHRLNALGFLDLSRFGAPYRTAANVGMLDCVAALHWIRDNIARFGGDPWNVCLFGQSGGGGKISTLMAMPPARGLFHRAIVESGSAVRVATQSEAAQTSAKLLAALGDPDLPALQAMPADRIIAAMVKAGIRATPTADGHVLPAQPFDPKAPVISEDIPLLIGFCETEATFFPATPLKPMDEATLIAKVSGLTAQDREGALALIGAFRKPRPEADPVLLFQLIASQWSIIDGVYLEADRKSDQRAPVYLYSFTRHSTARDGLLRSPHTLEIGYVFDDPDASPVTGPASAVNRAFADRISGLWAAFARRGVPAYPGVPVWPRYSRNERRVMVMGETFGVATDPLREGRLAVARLKRGVAD